jgi:hypothetical protein
VILDGHKVSTAQNRKQLIDGNERRLFASFSLMGADSEAVPIPQFLGFFEPIRHLLMPIRHLLIMAAKRLRHNSN